MLDFSDLRQAGIIFRIRFIGGAEPGLDDFIRYRFRESAQREAKHVCVISAPRAAGRFGIGA